MPCTASIGALPATRAPPARSAPVACAPNCAAVSAGDRAHQVAARDAREERVARGHTKACTLPIAIA